MVNNAGTAGLAIGPKLPSTAQAVRRCCTSWSCKREAKWVMTCLAAVRSIDFNAAAAVVLAC